MNQLLLSYWGALRGRRHKAFWEDGGPSLSPLSPGRANQKSVITALSWFQYDTRVLNLLSPALGSVVVMLLVLCARVLRTTSIYPARSAPYKACTNGFTSRRCFSCLCFFFFLSNLPKWVVSGQRFLAFAAAAVAVARTQRTTPFFWTGGGEGEGEKPSLLLPSDLCFLFL